MCKIISAALLISSLFTMRVNAQGHDGGLGNLFAGAIYNSGNGLQKVLKDENIIYNDLSLDHIVFAYGGAVYSVRPSQFVFGGSGYIYSVASKGNDGDAKLNVFSGFLNAGYCYFNTDKWLAFPYAGIGGYASNFKITNTTADKVFVLGNDTVAAGENGKYNAGALAFDAGFSIKYFNRKNSKANHKAMLLSGIDIGASFFFPPGNWNNVSTDNEIGFSNDPLIVAPYLRLSFGIGVFHTRK